MTVFFSLLPALVAVGIGVPVWFSADWFATRVFPGESPTPLSLDRLRGEPLFALALSIFGVLFVCEALPALVNGIALFVQGREGGSSILGRTSIDNGSSGAPPRRPPCPRALLVY